MRLAPAILLLAMVAACGRSEDPEPVPEHGAALFTWGAYLDTDIDAGRYFGGDHTLRLRFLPQFGAVYEGPLVASLAELPDRRFALSLEAHAADGQEATPHLTLRLGTRVERFPVEIAARRWHEVRLVRRGDALEVWLDGARQCPAGAHAHACAVPLEGFGADGPLRLGRRRVARDEPEPQFYGLIDGLAVSEGAQVRTPGTLRGTAQFVSVSATPADEADAGLLPVAATGETLTLPFAAGETWAVVRGFGDGPAFGWEFAFVPPSHPIGEPRPDDLTTEPRPLVAASDGVVGTLYLEPPPATGPPAIVLRRAGDEAMRYEGVRRTAAPLAQGQTVTRGDVLGEIWSPERGAARLGFALFNRTPEPGTEVGPAVSRPAHFGGYCASDDFGRTWTHVSVGVPARGQWVRQSDPAGSCG